MEQLSGKRPRLPSMLYKPILDAHFEWVDALNDEYMERPVIGDFFSGAGGSALGFYLAGFRVVGVDNRPMPRYPFEFHHADALEYCAEHGQEFDAINASPPCQDYSPLRARQHGKRYPDLYAPVKQALVECGKPYIIENVPHSPLKDYITLCGGMFGLRTYRHRRFEMSILVLQPPHPRHIARTSTKKRRRDFEAGMHISITGDVGSWLGPACMGIGWMTGDELSQAIPPAYTEFIGRQLMRVVRSTPTEEPTEAVR